MTVDDQNMPSLPEAQNNENMKVKHVPVDITTAFKDGVSLHNRHNPEILLNYVDTCAKMLYIGSKGPHYPISENEYEVKRYYTTKCIDIVFNGNYNYTPPEPIFIEPMEKGVDPVDAKGDDQVDSKGVDPVDAKGDDQVDSKGVDQVDSKGDDQVDYKGDEEEAVAKEEDKATNREDEAEANDGESKSFSISEFRPKVMKLIPPKELLAKVPVAYKESEKSQNIPIPVIEPSEGDAQTGNIKMIVKSVDELTDQDKAFIKNRYLSNMHNLYLRYVAMSNRFESMCHRGKELVRKLTTRRSRRCFKTSIDHSAEGSTTLELIPNPKGERDLKNINLWYQEFSQLYLERGRILRGIIDLVSESKRIQETPSWKYFVGEPVFDWKKRLEKFLLAPGNDDLLRFIQNSEIKLDESDVKDTDPVKEAVMFHFFNVSPKIIVQLAIAKLTRLFGDDAILQKEADDVVE